MEAFADRKSLISASKLGGRTWQLGICWLFCPLITGSVKKQTLTGPGPENGAEVSIASLDGQATTSCTVQVQLLVKILQPIQCLLLSCAGLSLPSNCQFLLALD